jgi:5'-nucleotidase
MREEIKAYIQRVKDRNNLEPNGEDVTFNYNESVIDLYTDYFKRCFRRNLSPYKALTFFYDELKYNIHPDHQIRTVYIDMDDTICDYKGRKRESLIKNPDNKYPQATFGFFSNLEPIPDAVEGVQRLIDSGKFEVYILTAPSYYNPMSYTEKRIWIEKYFGLEFTKNLIIAHNKGLLRGEYLIDNLYHEGFRGESIHYGTDERFLNWKDVTDYLLFENN